MKNNVYYEVSSDKGMIVSQKVKDFVIEVCRCELAKKGVSDINEINELAILIYPNLSDNVIDIIENGSKEMTDLMAMLIHDMKNPGRA